MDVIVGVDQDSTDHVAAENNFRCIESAADEFAVVRSGEILVFCRGVSVREGINELRRLDC